jgi:hypothetical protein
MRKSSLGVFHAFVFAAASSCAPVDRDMSTSEGGDALTIVTHPQPNLPKADVSPFLAAGCKLDGEELDCRGVASIEAFGCFRNVLGVDDLVSAMVPRGTAIASCDVRSGPGVKGIVHVGCRAAMERRYVVASAGRFGSIESKDELAALVKPVDTPEKALSLAAATTGAEPMYSIEESPTRRFLVDRIETTYVTRMPDGFVVRLFEREICGCGMHPTSAVDVFVTNAGEAQRMGAKVVFELTSEMCVD